MKPSHKTCFRCDRDLPLGMFYKHSVMKDGHLGKCKDCAKLDVRNNYALKRSQYQAYEKRRFQTPKRKVGLIEAQRRRRKNNPEKYKAYNALSYAVKSGKLVQGPCVYCGNPKSQGHHDDYSKPLDVRWVCFKCHREKEHGQVVLDSINTTVLTPF